MPKIVTAHTGVKHITSDDVGALHQAIIGSNDYLLSDNPEDFKAVMLNADTIQMPEAEVVVQGTHIRILNTDKVQIEAGQNGLKRIDIIVLCYAKSEDGVESTELKVVKGEASAAPTAPSVIQSDIRNGGLYHEMPLFRVDINGVSVEAVTSLCETVKSLYSVFQLITEQTESIKGLKSRALTLEEKAKTIDSNAEAIQEINTNNLLWSGSSWMRETDTVNLSSPVSKQTNGIILVFSSYSGVAKNDDIQCFAVPKWLVNKHGGSNYKFPLYGGLASAFALKALYISDTAIKGNVNNAKSGNGVIPYDNSAFVLRYVIGF